jgi:hypothetical protein
VSDQHLPALGAVTAVIDFNALVAAMLRYVWQTEIGYFVTTSPHSTRLRNKKIAKLRFLVLSG